MKKCYYEMDNLGRAKYTVSKHDGISKNKDGSPFFDIAIFSNKRKKQAYIRKLRADGYVYR